MNTNGLVSLHFDMGGLPMTDSSTDNQRPNPDISEHRRTLDILLIHSMSSTNKDLGQLYNVRHSYAFREPNLYNGEVFDDVRIITRRVNRVSTMENFLGYKFNFMDSVNVTAPANHLIKSEYLMGAFPVDTYKNGREIVKKYVLLSHFGLEFSSMDATMKTHDIDVTLFYRRTGNTLMARVVYDSELVINVDSRGRYSIRKAGLSGVFHSESSGNLLSEKDQTLSVDTATPIRISAEQDRL